MKKILALMVTGVLAVSCAPPNVKLDQDAALKGNKSLQVLVTQTPDFNLMTGGTSATWGILGPLGAIGSGVSAASNGAELVRENQIPDPAIAIATQLGKGMQKAYGVKLASDQPVLLQTVDDATIEQMYHGTDYTLLIGTLVWQTLHNLAGDLAVGEGISMKLKETASKKVLASAYCYKKTDHDYGLDELRDHKARKLKEILLDLQSKCLDEFTDKLLIGNDFNVSHP